jgi:hypothetical protein
VTAIHRLMSTTVAASTLLIGGLVPEMAARTRDSSGRHSVSSPRHRLSVSSTGQARHAIDPRGSAPRYDDATIDVAPHIRVEDERLSRLLDYGRKRSALLESLINRLEASDVVVFVRWDNRPRSGVAGKLSFVGMSAGTRYVLVRVGYVGDRLRQIALIGHELRHGVEVADTPAIVDTASFKREYARMGFVNRRASVAGVTAFESIEAVEAGQRILRELQNGTE